MATLERLRSYAKVVCIWPRRSALVLLVRSCGPSPSLISGGIVPANRHVSKAWRPKSYCLDTYLEEYRKGRIPQGATRRLKTWLIVALLEAFRYTVQETKAVPRAREMAALTWLGAYLSGNRKATGMI